MAKLQHYVPQSYLKAFASSKGKNAKIWCYDKVLQKAFETNVHNVGGEQFFYHLVNEQDQAIEDAFQKLETAFLSARQRLKAANRAGGLPKEDLAVISLFIGAQMIRTREHRQHLEDMMKQTLVRLGDQATPELLQWLGPSDSEHARRQQVHNLQSDMVPRLAEVISAMKWIVIINQTPQPFWTSDHPVTLYNPIDAGPRGNLGLSCRGIQLFFPISPEICLCTCDPIEYASLPSTMTAGPDNVLFQNSLQVQSSTRHLFSARSNFRLAEEMLEEEPALGDIKRRRVIVS